LLPWEEEVIASGRKRVGGGWKKQGECAGDMVLGPESSHA
jgi:hypothetical protein